MSDKHNIKLNKVIVFLKENSINTHMLLGEARTFAVI